MAITGYCLKCKKKVDIKDPVHITMKNGKPATTGSCPTWHKDLQDRQSVTQR